MRFRFRAAVALLVAVLVSAGITAQRRDVFVAPRDHAAIRYSATQPTDEVAVLNRKLADGSVALKFDATSGYLRSVLEALKVPIESQSLVFSKTSFQAPLIRIDNPRAVYFSDTISVGWVRGGEVLEISAVDPRQGVIFYTVDQTDTTRPQFRRNDSCLACHLAWETAGVPGLIVHSVHPLPDEISYVNGYTTTHGSLMTERWGGWWVTGNHGGARHMGNIPVMPAEKGKAKLANPRQPLKSVEGLFDLKGYPTPYSDVVAMMVLAHQTHMTNLITRVGWEARLADADRSEDAVLRTREAAVDLVDYMLFVHEAPLAGPIEGSSGFAATFTNQAPRDANGGSARALAPARGLVRDPGRHMICPGALGGAAGRGRERG